jgi:uncharacterized membrane-anchored protein
MGEGSCAPVHHGRASEGQMNTPADSLLLASANLAVIGVLRLLDHLGCCRFGGRAEVIGFMAAVTLVFVVPPVLLFFTVGYAVKDLVRRGTRLQALIAPALSIPVWNFLQSIQL